MFEANVGDKEVGGDLIVTRTTPGADAYIGIVVCKESANLLISAKIWVKLKMLNVYRKISSKKLSVCVEG